MSSKRASQEEHALEIERLRSLIERIYEQAETLQGDARELPDGVAKGLGENAGDLLQTADALSDEVERLEVKHTPLDTKGAPAPRPSRTLLASTTPAVWSGETFVTLEFGAAKDLRRELANLTEHFGQKQSASGTPYYIVLGMTPVTDDNLELK